MEDVKLDLTRESISITWLAPEKSAQLKIGSSKFVESSQVLRPSYDEA